MNQKNFMLAFFFLIGFPFVFANGGIMPRYDYSGEIFLPEQRAVIYWDGSQEQMILSTKISVDDISDFAWVVPVQSDSKPLVEEADEEIFFELVRLFTKQLESKGFGTLGVFGSASAGVEVIETKKVDIYDITILKATDSNALLDWLNDNGYTFPPEKINVLEY